MRIAFVGKGGSGKTTMAALFSQFLVQEGINNILSIDADINVHLPEMLTGNKFPRDKFISLPDSSNRIKEYLMGKNSLVELQTFRKTTPPTRNSNLIYLGDCKNPILKEFSVNKNQIKVMAVGTYESEGIGASCYHNNLSILENILTHLVDKEDAVVVDMVAGTDAFASSLHAQFDIIVLVVEPTKKGVEVFRDYYSLGKSAGVEKDIFVVGNKVLSQEDRNFLSEMIPEDRLIGFVSSSDYLRKHDKAGGVIDSGKLELTNREVLKRILGILKTRIKNPNERLEKIHSLHKKYVSQGFIKERFGDLTNQIDTEFKF